MSYTIVSGATTLAPVYSIDGDNLTYVLNSSNNGMCSMKYVADIYGLASGSTAVVRIMSSPEPETGLGIISLNRVLEDFIGFDYFPGLYGATTAVESLKNYIVRFGEETDGTYGCTGASFAVNPNLAISGLRYVFNGCVQYADQFQYLDYLVNDNTTPTVRKFLTNAPIEQSINVDEEAYLYVPTQHVGGGTSLHLQVDVNYLDGSTALYYVSGYDFSLTFIRMDAWGVGPVNINLGASYGIVLNSVGATVGATSIIDCSVESYDVKIVTYPF